MEFCQSESGNPGVFFKIIVYRMEFDTTRWSCSWNSDQNCTQNSDRVIFCQSKTGTCAVTSTWISFQFPEVV